jgi:hypothetical protein
VNDFPLDADAAPVNDANVAESLQSRLVEIFLDDVGDFPRSESVQVDPVFDW